MEEEDKHHALGLGKDHVITVYSDQQKGKKVGFKPSTLSIESGDTVEWRVERELCEIRAKNVRDFFFMIFSPIFVLRKFFSKFFCG